MMIPGIENILGIEDWGDYQKDLQIGSFLFYEDTKVLLFQDAQEKLHDLSKVFLLSSKWNFAEGDKSFPKPFIIGAGGEIKDYGAYCLYSFINNTLSNVVILGQIVNPNFDSPDDKLDFAKNDLTKLLGEQKVRNNTKRYYSVAEDEEGNLIVLLEGKENNGNIYIKLVGNSSQTNGNIKIDLNGKFVLNQVTDEGETYAQIMMDNTSGEEKIQVKDKHKNKVEMNKKGTIINAETIDITGKDSTDGLNLKTLVVRLIDYIIAIRQPTNNGATQGPPMNMGDFISLKNDVEKLLKENV